MDILSRCLSMFLSFLNALAFMGSYAYRREANQLTRHVDFIHW